MSTSIFTKLNYYKMVILLRLKIINEMLKENFMDMDLKLLKKRCRET